VENRENLKIMKIEKLTKEQESQLELYKNKWLNKIFNYELNKSSSFVNVKNQMKDMYKFCNLDEPIVLYLDSPLACQIAANILCNENQVWNQVRNQVRNQVENQVWNQVRNQVRNQVENQVGNQVWNQVWNQVENQVENQVGNQVGNQVWNQVWNQDKMSYYTFSYYINFSDFGILSFFDFMDNTLNLTLNKDWEKWSNWSESSFMSIQLEGLCIVSNFPNFISRNESNEMHNLDGFAIKFNDGYGLNYVNGKYLPVDVFEVIKSNKYSLEQFLTESNEEIKSAAIEMMQLLHGDSFLVRFFGDNLKEADVFIDKKEERFLEGTTKGMNVGVYTLYKGEINGNKIAYIQCYCPSTDRMFFLGVEPKHTKAKDAIASLYRVPTIVKDEIKTISRQGERFFTAFTEKGYDKLKSTSEIKEYSTISGDEYFSKMRYEF